MELLVILILGVPLALTVWLVIRAISARDRIEELTRRVDGLQQEISLLKTSRTPPKSSREAGEIFAPATPPPVNREVTQGLRPSNTTRESVFPIPPIVPPPPIVPLPPEIIPAAKPEPEPVLASPRIPAIAETESESAPAPAPERTSFEMRLGTFWLVRVGVVMLLTSLAFFGNYAYHHIIGKLGPGGKISLLYLASGLLLGAGAWWQRRNAKASLKNYAQVLFAGGLAAVYFTTYAAHHIPPLRVIASAVVDGTLLLVWAGVIAWIADRRKSEVMALFAVGLAFYSSVITRAGDFTLWSNLVLTIAAVVFLIRNRWVSLSFAGLATSYAGYAFWRFLHDNGWHWATPGEGLNVGVAFLAAYWLVFTAASFLSRCEKLSGQNRAAFLTLNNGAFFALFILTMLQVHSGGFWRVCLGYGTVLLALAGLARKMLPDEPLAKTAYLTQGLLLVTLGLVSKFAGLQLALVLGVESVVLFVLGTQRPSAVLKFFAHAAALLATGWCVANLKPFDSIGLWTGAALGALMIFNAFWSHRVTGENPAPVLRAEPSAFTLLAFASWLGITWFNTTAGQLPLALAGGAVALTFSIYLLRIREVTLLGQLFLVLAQIAWLFHFLTVTPPWWNPLGLIVVTIGLSHWWAWQKRVTLSGAIQTVYSTVFALAAVGVVVLWLHPLVEAPTWLVLTSLLAVVVTIYGIATRAWALVICGQIFLAISAWEFLQELVHEKPEWYFPLAPLAVLGMLSFAAVAWFTRKPESGTTVRAPLLQVALIYRWLALAMSLLWTGEYVPEPDRVWAFMLVTVAVFALAVWRRNREALLATAVYLAASLATFWWRDDFAMDISRLNLLALLTLFVLQQVLRRHSAGRLVDEKIHGTVVLAAGLSLWRFLSCWAATFTGGFFITMIWAGFAVLLFAAGIILRERFHRWLGLGVLAAAVARVGLVDVWKQETIWRVLTFMALGLALVVIGFIYNKYQEKIRQWL